MNYTQSFFEIEDSEEDLLKMQYYQNVIAKHNIKTLYDGFKTAKEITILNKEAEYDKLTSEKEQLQLKYEEIKNSKKAQPTVNSLKQILMEVTNIIKETSMEMKVNHINVCLENYEKILYVTGLKTSEMNTVINLIQEAMTKSIDSMPELDTVSIKDLKNLVKEINQCRSLCSAYLRTTQDNIKDILKFQDKLIQIIQDNMTNTKIYTNASDIDMKVRTS